MRARFGILASKALLLVCGVGAGACDEVDAQRVSLPDKLTLPTVQTAPTNNTARNLELAVSTTDAAGRSPGQAGFAGASLSGQCRIYLNNVTPVTSSELYDLAFRHLDKVVQEGGGIEAFVKNPDLIPAAHIWADVNTPWRCVEGAIYNVQVAGYPTVGFITRPTQSPSAPFGSVQALYIDLPAPIDMSSVPEVEPITNKIVLTAKSEILWNDQVVQPAKLLSFLEQASSLSPKPKLEFGPQADVSYASSVQLLMAAREAHGSDIDFANGKKYRSFGKDESGVDPTRHAN